MVNDWIGREIKIPNNFQRNLLRADTGMKVDSELINSEYRILLYVASVGCMTCKLHLQKWGKLIREFEQASLNKLSFLFFSIRRIKKRYVYY